jgi:hypothetical protein
MRRLIIAGCVAAALGCSTTKEVEAPPAAQPVVVTPSAPPAKVIVVPSN